MKEKVSFPDLAVSLIEEGILLVEFKKIKEMSIQHVDQLYEGIIKLGKGKKVCLVSVFQGYIPMNDEVMAYSIRKEHRQYIFASAVVLNSVGLRVAVKFYWAFHKPKEPRQIFSSKEKALAWLKKIRKEKKEKDPALA